MVQHTNVTRLRIAVLAVLALIVFTVTAQAQISIVVSKSSGQTADPGILKQFFTGSKLAWASGEKIVVADQQETAVGKTFYDKFLGKSVSTVRTEWTKLVLSGQALAPKKCSDDDAVKKAVAENPNAVGYISSGALDGTVKEIHRIQ